MKYSVETKELLVPNPCKDGGRSMHIHRYGSIGILQGQALDLPLFLERIVI